MEVFLKKHITCRKNREIQVCPPWHLFAVTFFCNISVKFACSKTMYYPTTPPDFTSHYLKQKNVGFNVRGPYLI
jgi:hypothetical protein